MDVKIQKHFITVLFVLEKLPELLEAINQIVCKVIGNVNSAVEKINSLDVDGVELKQQNEKCKQNLEAVTAKGEAFLNSVIKLLCFANLDASEIEQHRISFQHGDFKPLKDYITQIRRYLERSENHYQAFLSAFREAKSLCKDTSTRCEKKMIEARNWKVVARAVGGGATVAALGAGIGGGVTLSIVAGVFTFGIGTVVGLSITAVAAMTAGVGTAAVAGVATHLVAESFEKARATFESICSELGKTDLELKSLERRMSDLEMVIASVIDDIENVDASIASDVQHKQFCKVFDILVEGIKAAHDKSTGNVSTTTMPANSPTQAP